MRQAYDYWQNQPGNHRRALFGPRRRPPEGVTARVVNDISPVLASPVLRLLGARAHPRTPFGSHSSSPQVFHGAPSRSRGGPPQGANTSRERSGAQSEGAPSPGGAAIQRSQSRGMRPCCSMGNLARGQPPTEPIRVRPSGTMTTEVTLRASPRQHATLAAEPAGGLKPPWSNGAPTWRARGRARRSEGRKSTRRFRVRIWDHVGVPGQAGQPPHSEGVRFSFFSFIYPAASKRGSPRPHRFRCVLLKSRNIPKGGEDKKCAHAGGRGDPPGQAAGWPLRRP